MDQEIIARLKQRITREGLDAIIAISPENLTYVSGFVVPSQALMRWHHAICILTADGRISMVAIDMESTTVKAHAGIDDLRRCLQPFANEERNQEASCQGKGERRSRFQGEDMNANHSSSTVVAFDQTC